MCLFEHVLLRESVVVTKQTASLPWSIGCFYRQNVVTPGGVERVGRNVRPVRGSVSQPVPHPDGAVSAAGAYHGNSDSPVGGGRPVRSGGVCPGRSRGVLERLVLRG